MSEMITIKRAEELVQHAVKLARKKGALSKWSDEELVSFVMDGLKIDEASIKTLVEGGIPREKAEKLIAFARAAGREMANDS